MTVLAAVHVPGVGCVIAADGRVTAGTHLIVDDCNKILRLGSVVFAVCGQDGGLFGAIGACSNLSELVANASKYAAERPSLDWSGLVYDRERDMLLELYSDGNLITHNTRATGGCGGELATGWLQAHRPARDLKQARALAVGAVRAAIKHDVACGGKVRAVTVKAPPQ